MLHHHCDPGAQPTVFWAKLLPLLLLVTRPQPTLLWMSPAAVFWEEPSEL